MFCPNCGAEAKEHGNFCAACGCKIPLKNESNANTINRLKDWVDRDVSLVEMLCGGFATLNILDYEITYVFSAGIIWVTAKYFICAGLAYFPAKKFSIHFLSRFKMLEAKQQNKIAIISVGVGVIVLFISHYFMNTFIGSILAMLIGCFFAYCMTGSKGN